MLTFVLPGESRGAEVTCPEEEPRVGPASPRRLFGEGLCSLMELASSKAVWKAGQHQASATHLPERGPVLPEPGDAQQPAPSSTFARLGENGKVGERIPSKRGLLRSERARQERQVRPSKHELTHTHNTHTHARAARPHSPSLNDPSAARDTRSHGGGAGRASPSHEQPARHEEAERARAELKPLPGAAWREADVAAGRRMEMGRGKRQL